MKLSAAATLAASFALLAAPAYSQVIYSFANSGAGGLEPDGSLVMDPAGALYGVTYDGGANNAGTAYRLTPPPAGQTGWSYTKLFDFPGGAGGAYPIYNLVIGAAGTLYGVTQSGGPVGQACMGVAVGCGTVYQLSPPAAGQTPWTYTVLANISDFEPNSFPSGGLVRGSDGTLYGPTDGNFTPASYGGVYKLTPPAAGHANWTPMLLHSFAGPDGWSPNGTLAMGPGGSLFGVTEIGGPITPACEDGCGIVFRLAPPASGQTAWREQTLYELGSVSGDGILPVGAILGADGSLYGTTLEGGDPTSNGGTVFSLAPPKNAGIPWTETTLYRFGAPPDGAEPLLLQRTKSGDLYGATDAGGANLCSGTAGCGMLFKLTPPAAGSGVWTESATYQLSPGTGAVPEGLLLGTDQALYVTNVAGGPTRGDVGTILRLAQ